REPRHLAPDLAEPHDAHGLAGDLLTGEALPTMPALLAFEPQYILAEHQHGKEDELGERTRMHTARRRDGDGALRQSDAVGELADTRARRLDPAQTRPRCERRRELERPEVEQHLRLVEQRVPALSRGGV